MPNDFEMTHVYESKDIRGTWVRFETLSYIVVFDPFVIDNYDLKNVECFSFPQVSMDIFEVNLVQSSQFLTVTGQNHVPHKNFSTMQR